MADCSIGSVGPVVNVLICQFSCKYCDVIVQSHREQKNLNRLQNMTKTENKDINKAPEENN